MAIGFHHLSVAELEARVRSSSDGVERSHCQAIWLLAKGHTTAEVAAVTALSQRWVSKLARRYERDGADALGDLRRRNPGGKPLLSMADLDVLDETSRNLMAAAEDALRDGVKLDVRECRAA